MCIDSKQIVLNLKCGFNKPMGLTLKFQNGAKMSNSRPINKSEKFIINFGVCVEYPT